VRDFEAESFDAAASGGDQRKATRALFSEGLRDAAGELG
jgi:hypothetical protein